ncbi:helix-turn-helix domain-containing protein [Streptomyces griseomycini]|uniref:Transcriptional regulator with XRE-family HTH domain n=1 Tax=Streptomyces griseomycini TaxID=66895 RepID=A0A7W7M305_9ACTN|nr:helix-turn-helix transcriptional regulator [Streptomyces griseomycini]MBB4900451.1 transcriptional regulator with XRE-family HTH domain [Streptomyces griseomycini]GGR38352.1 transcriptional regulator [Streptomyces griseomycini]
MAVPVDGQRESGRAVLGRTLKFLRDKEGRSLGQLAEETGYDKSYLSRLESGQRLSKVTVMEDLDSYYGSDGLLVSLWKIARYDAFKDKYKEFMRLEATARVMRKYAPEVPGLLQTEEFAREMLSGPLATGQDTEAVEEQVAARLGRQLLLGKDPAPSVRFIIDELAFRRPSARAETWRGQLAHIEAVAQWPNIVVQVLPFSAGLHPLMAKGSLTLLWQADGSAVAYTEGDSSGLLTDDPEDVLRHRLSYDRLRDLALSPPDSLVFIRDALKEHSS